MKNKLCEKLRALEIVDDPEKIGTETTKHKYKLMLKQHWETGISYLCITSLDDFRKYRGSGVRWTSLLKKNPGPIHTSLLFSTDNKEELAIVAEYYSNFHDVVNNPNFANLIPETGYAIDSKWGKAAADACIKSGNHSGIFSKKWREENKEKCSVIFSNAGKIGGKITGSMFWWNNGSINKRSINCPGEGWVRGMLMSEKKLSQVKKWTKLGSPSGKIWMTNGISSKQLTLSEAKEYSQNGWYRCRK
jgi:hypothetical protein